MGFHCGYRGAGRMGGWKGVDHGEFLRRFPRSIQGLGCWLEGCMLTVGNRGRGAGDTRNINILALGRDRFGEIAEAIYIYITGLFFFILL